MGVVAEVEGGVAPGADRLRRAGAVLVAASATDRPPLLPGCDG